MGVLQRKGVSDPRRRLLSFFAIHGNVSVADNLALPSVLVNTPGFEQRQIQGFDELANVVTPTAHDLAGCWGNPGPGLLGLAVVPIFNGVAVRCAGPKTVGSYRIA